MKKILLFGAGKSATFLIEYLMEESRENGWQFTICDANLELAQSKIKGGNGIAVSINVEDDSERKKLVKDSDVVISMMPPSLHFLIAKDCVEFGNHLLTASYVDEQIRSLEKDIDEKKLLFICEMGLDPGIDHMSAMKMINSIRKDGGTIHSFISHCGGLVAPENDNNPWHYKISWNPRNIVLAGKDGAKYFKDKYEVTIPYREIFQEPGSVVVPGEGTFSWYPNRDSLDYISTYRLEGISTFIRTTLRHPAFCRGWNKIVNIGFTDTADHEQIKNCKTFNDWFETKTKLINNQQNNINDPYKNEFGEQISFLGMQTNGTLPSGFNSSTDILQHLLEIKLALKAGDKDMIIMLHEIAYSLKGDQLSVKSSLVLKGEDNVRTAMAKTVGLPLGIATKLILQDKIKLTGLHIPTVPEIYEPVLKELEMHGIKFH